MASTLRMRTTISPRPWQPWTAVSPLLGFMVVRMRKVLAIPQSWYVCFNAVNWYCFKFIWAHRSIFLIPSPYACRGRTVLQFPTNSYHLFTVELALKAVLALASAVNVLWYASNPPLIDPTAMPGGWAPIRANQLSMVVRMHKVVRMRKVLAITQWWYVCFSAVNWYC